MGVVARRQTAVVPEARCHTLSAFAGKCFQTLSAFSSPAPVALLSFSLPFHAQPVKSSLLVLPSFPLLFRPSLSSFPSSHRSY